HGGPSSSGRRVGAEPGRVRRLSAARRALSRRPAVVLPLGHAGRELRREEGVMAKIKHIAIRTPDPEKTAAFYKNVFGLKEVGQARRGCYLSDGHINLAILQSTDHDPD